MTTSTSFDLTLFDDEPTRKKLSLLSKLEVMFDDSRNELPQSYYNFIGDIPFGAKVRVTFELLPSDAPAQE